MPLNAAPGEKFRMLIDTALPFDSSSINVEIDSDNITLAEEIISPDGLRGSREMVGTRAVRGRRTVSGTVTMSVTPAVLGAFLTPVMGGTPSAGVYNVTENLPTLQFLIDSGDDIRQIENVTVASMTVTSEPGQPVKVTFAIEAEDVTGSQSWPGSPPAIANDPIFIHAMFSDAAWGSDDCEHHRFEYTIDNVVTTDEFANSYTRDGRILPQDRRVSGSLEVDAISENAAIIGGKLSDSLTLVAVSGSWTWTCLIGLAQSSAQKPVTTGKNQRHITIPFVGRASASNPSFRQTIVSA